MARISYTPDFKAQIVLEVLREEKELNAIASEHNFIPNMVWKWKRSYS